MKKFITRDKLSKKARRELNKQQRISWNGINPATKKVESKKLYNRKKAKIGVDDSCSEPFYVYAYAGVCRDYIITDYPLPAWYEYC